MRILLLGANGQLGCELKRTLPMLGDVEACDRNAVDLTDASSITDKINAFNPDIIVNAAAYTTVDKAETDKDTAHCVNSEAVKIIAQETALRGCLLIHFSTDYVFNGNKSSRYTEEDDVDPVNYYGETKLSGEREIANSKCEHLIFRTTWVIGKDGNNFAKTILNLAKKLESLGIVSDQYGVPTSPALIAKVVSEAIRARKSSKDWPSGIYHLSPKGETSWYGIAKKLLFIAEEAGVELTVTADKLKEITTDEYPTPANRPSNSLLNTAKLDQVLSFNLPDWETEFSSIMQHIIREEMQHET